jgi:hypothetical protein
MSFPIPFRSRASSKNLSASHRRLNGFLPPDEPYPFLLPKCYSRAGPFALLGFLTSQALPPLCPMKRFSLFTLPLSLTSSKTLILKVAGTQGSSHSGLALSLRKGRRPVWPFSPRFSATTSNCEPASDYFFLSESLSPYEDRVPLFEADPSLPCGRWRTL